MFSPNFIAACGSVDIPDLINVLEKERLAAERKVIPDSIAPRLVFYHQIVLFTFSRHGVLKFENNFLSRSQK